MTEKIKLTREQTEAAERLAEKERKEAEKAEAEAAAAAEEDAEQERLSNRTVAEALVEDNSRVHDAELSEHGHLSITMDAHGSWSENSIATNHAFLNMYLTYKVQLRYSIR